MSSCRKKYGEYVIRDLDDNIPDQDAVVGVGRYEKLEVIDLTSRVWFMC